MTEQAELDLDALPLAALRALAAGLRVAEAALRAVPGGGTVDLSVGDGVVTVTVALPGVAGHD